MSISFFRSRQFPRLCSALVVPWIFLYLYFAILPSYQSGLYRLSETQIETGHVDIPGYTFEPICHEPQKLTMWDESPFPARGREV